VVNGVLEFNAIYTVEEDNRSLRLNVKIRQHLEDVLHYLAGMYEICVFTAGEQGYADTILDFIDADYQIIKHRLYRHHCVQAAPGVFIKDLRVISDRDIKDIVIVDNSIVSFAF
jgi:TFIIF-interacting CTD phosphatase-like protein